MEEELKGTFEDEWKAVVKLGATMIFLYITYTKLSKFPELSYLDLVIWLVFMFIWVLAIIQ